MVRLGARSGGLMRKIGLGPTKGKFRFNRKKLGSRMSNASKGYARRFAMKGGSKNLVRSKQTANLANRLTGKKLPMQPAGRYSSPAELSSFVSMEQAALSGGRGVVAGKKPKKKIRKKLKAQKVKGTQGVRGNPLGSPPMRPVTAFNPSPYGGDARSLGVRS